MNRIEALRGFLKDDPKDSFSRYALALEYVKIGQHDDAVREFEMVKTNDPDYVATYFHLGQLYQKIGQSHLAEKTFRTGISVASKLGDEHTRSELEGALESLIISGPDPGE
jgi:Tfp pilus assembly protein PilF